MSGLEVLVIPNTYSYSCLGWNWLLTGHGLPSVRLASGTGLRIQLPACACSCSVVQLFRSVWLSSWRLASRMCPPICAPGYMETRGTASVCQADSG